WDANDETHWMVYYGEEGFDPETEGESIEVTDEPTVNLTDLEDETTYQVYVKTICGDDEESILIGPISFTTNITPPENTRICDAIALDPNTGCIGGPYTNTGAFEEYLEPTGSCLNDFHGTNSVWFTFEAPANGLATISTDFNSTDFLTEIVVFEAPTDCEDMTTLGEEVGCASASEETIGNLELEGLTPGDTYYVKIAGFNNTDGEFCIEVELEETPPCPDPSNISVDEIGADYVELSWTPNGDESEWEVAYGEPGFDPDNEEEESVIVNNIYATLTDLEPKTDYEVYVRAICSVNNISDWSNSEIFTTEEMSIDTQLFENFTYFPNPVENQLNLKADSQIDNVEVFNLLG